MSKLMFTGVQVLEPSVFDHMPAPSDIEKFSTTRDIFPRMLLQGEPLFGFRFDGFWQDLGTLDRIQAAEGSLSADKAKLHYIRSR